MADTITPSRPSRLYSTVWAILAAFGTYFCMYAFRKPFTAAGYKGEFLWGIDFKTILVTAQVAGYTLSKFIGIKVIAEMTPARRAGAILLLIGFAQVALLLFGIVPRPWNLAALFLNGLPLGMVFGLVIGFLEGRQLTEAMTAGLCASFILADGVVKSVGTLLLNQGVREDWMPAVAGAAFVPPLLLCVWMLTRIAPPSAEDIAARAERTVMNRSERRALLGRYALGIALLTLMYLVMTIVRSVRADFAPEIWKGLGETAAPSVFSQSEAVVAMFVLAVNGGTVLIRDNHRAFFASLATCGLGFVLIASALLAWRAGVIGGFAFMTIIGLGIYLPYVAVNATLFERMLAMTRERGNVGFLIYVADSIGYLGYVGVILGKGSLSQRGDIFGLFTILCWSAVAISIVCVVGSLVYFALRGRTPVEAVVARQA